MNDTIHIKVEIVKLHIVRVWLSCVHRDLHISKHLSLQHTHIGNQETYNYSYIVFAMMGYLVLKVDTV